MKTMHFAALTLTTTLFQFLTEILCLWWEKVILKMKSKHVAGTVTKKKKSESTTFIDCFRLSFLNNNNDNNNNVNYLLGIVKKLTLHS